MAFPVRIAFRGIEPSAFVEARVRERVARLERLHDRIASCHTTIELPHQHSRKGELFAVHLRIEVPGDEIIVNREHNDNHAHEDVYVAVRDAFDAAERKLEDSLRQRDHRKTKAAHAPPTHGRVLRTYPQQDYGFIETSDGLDVYFHANSVADGRFTELSPGDEVRVEIAPHESEKGPQASTVRAIGKHHLVG